MRRTSATLPRSQSSRNPPSVSWNGSVADGQPGKCSDTRWRTARIHGNSGGECGQECAEGRVGDGPLVERRLGQLAVEGEVAERVDQPAAGPHEEEDDQPGRDDERERQPNRHRRRIVRKRWYVTSGVARPTAGSRPARSPPTP